MKTNELINNQDLLKWAVKNIEEWNVKYPNLRADGSGIFYTDDNLNWKKAWGSWALSNNSGEGFEWSWLDRDVIAEESRLLVITRQQYLEEKKKMNNTFKKSDLKTGYRVTIDGYKPRIVFLGANITYNGDEISDFLVCSESKSYSWDYLKYISEKTITKVERPKHPYDIFYHSSGWEVLWEKQPEKTKEQLAYEQANENLNLALEKLEEAKAQVELLKPKV